MKISLWQNYCMKLKHLLLLPLIGLYSSFTYGNIAHVECTYADNIDFIGSRQWKKQRNLKVSWYQINSSQEVVNYIGINTGELFRLGGVSFSSEYISGIACGSDCTNGYPRGMNRKTLEIIEGGGFGRSLVGKCEVIDEDKFKAKQDELRKIKEARESDNVI